MINICLAGASGRMGNAIVDECKNYPNISIVSGFVAPGESNINMGFPLFNEAKDIEKICRDVDIWVDFTTPSAIVSYIPLIVQQGVDLVIGTTGWYDKLGDIEDAIEKSCVSAILCPNFSPLVNLQFKLAAISAECLADFNYSFGIVEEHHENKLDIPSGTADKLADIVMRYTAYTEKRFRGIGKRKKTENELDMASLRLKGTVGDHELRIRGEYGRMDISTNVYTRKEFAKGAVWSSEWLHEHRKDGVIYDFYKDVLGL